MLDVHGAAMSRATPWLRSYGLTGITPTPLIAARLDARRRIATRAAPLVWPLVLVLGVVLVVRGARSHLVDAVYLACMVAVALLGALLAWWIQRAVRRADRRIAAMVERRVAHPVPPGISTILGRLGLAVVVVIQGGGLAVGLLVLLFSATAQDKLAALILVVVVAAFAVLTAFAAVDAVRRPALADDADSLAVDDVLRLVDVRRLVGSPLPALLAVSFAHSLSAASVAWKFVWIGYGVTGMLVSLGLTLLTQGAGRSAGRVRWSGAE